MTCGIYEIRNKITDWKYVGSGYDLKDRWRVHRKALRENSHSNKHLQRSWNRYGEEAFDFKVLEECERENLIIREQSYLPAEKTLEALKLNKFFNLCPVAGSTLGVSTNKGRTFSEESRKKMSEAAKKRGISAETREKIKLANAGKKRTYSEESRKKISAANKGKKRSEEARKKMSEAWEYRVVSEETGRKISAANKGRKGKTPSEETRRKIGAANKKRAAERKEWIENWITVNLKPFGWRIYDTSHE